MKEIKRVLGFCITFIGVISVSAYAEEPVEGELLQEILTAEEIVLASLLETNRNIEGEFRQVTYDEAGDQSQLSEGVFLLAMR